MIDIKAFRENPDLYARGAKRKGHTIDVDAILVLDKARRELIGEVETLKKEANEIAAHGANVSDDDRARGKQLKAQIKIKEEERAGVEEQLNERAMEIPNPPMDDVPDGTGENDNVVVRSWGDPRTFDFTARDHLDLAESLDIIDFERGAKIAGSSFYFLKNEAVLLEHALVRFALDILADEGFTILTPPHLARERFYQGTGYLPRGPEAQTYQIAGEDLGLIATAEVPLAGYHADEQLDAGTLPRRYAAVSHCFRKEAGSYGQYSRGLYRVHQFVKVEMFCHTTPEDSPGMHEELVRIEERIFRALEIPYRVSQMCAGDLGAQAVKKFDLEAWMPGRDGWGEVTSASNTTDYQSRRLAIRYKTSDGTDFVHTLNGTAVATPRTMIAILENFQQKDGSVNMPKSLHPYLPFKKIGPKA